MSIGIKDEYIEVVLMTKRGVKITTFLLVMALILMVLPFPLMKGSLSNAELVTKTQHTIIVNASGGGDYTHIQWAIDNASDGGTVYVEAGTYCENVKINKTLNLIGESRKNTVIDGGGNGIVVKVSVDKVNISEFRITNGSCGIYLFNSNHCRIENNNCSNNLAYGIRLEGSEGHCNYNSIINNTCNSNSNGMGFVASIGLCNDNIIINNTCNSNKYDGIELFIMWGLCDRNLIHNNTCNYNGNNGIELQESNSNNISYNICIYNTNYAICLYGGTNNNIIHHNTIINNNGSNLALDYGKGNLWNTSKEGNYWSKWSAPDNNSDGIVDIPYNISGTANTKDYFPLVKPIYDLLPTANVGLDITVDQYETVTFNGTDSWGFPLISNYTWYFIYDKASRFLYGPTPIFTFNIPGIYVVSLRVVDEEGNWATDSMILTVKDSLNPVGFAGDDITIDQHDIALFNGSLSHDNVGIVNYTWSFLYQEEEMHIYGVTTSYRFDDAGLFEVVLNVSDTEGNWAIDSLNVTVRDITPPIADAGPDMTINQSEEVVFIFHQNSSDNVFVKNFTWTFYYDGIVQTLFYSTFMSSLPSVKFEIPGTYLVTLNVSDPVGNWAIDTLNVTVLDTMLPLANGGSNIVIGTNTTFFFNASGSEDNIGIVNYTWTFNYNEEQVTLYGISPFFRFDKAGDYTLTLKVTDSDGNLDLDVFDITVNPISDPGDPDDDIGPDEDGGSEGEKKTTFNIWMGIIVGVFVVAVVGVLVYVLRKKKKDKAEQSSEDDLGRVEKGKREEGE